MRVLYGIIVFFALFLLACSDAEREEKRLEGNLLMKGDSGVCLMLEEKFFGNQ